MSWHFLQGQEVASWGGSSLVGAPSALLSLIPTAEASSLPASATASCPPSPSGMTCEPSTGSLGGGTSMSSAEASHAKTFPALERRLDSTVRSLDSGTNSPVWFAKLSPDGSTWRTPQISLFGDSGECSPTWPRSGSMRNGVCWERTMPEPRIIANAFGLQLTTERERESSLRRRRQLPINSVQACGSGVAADAYSKQLRNESGWLTREGRQDKAEPRNDGETCTMADTESTRPQKTGGGSGVSSPLAGSPSDGWWTVEPGMGRVADGVANRVDRTRAIGEGQVPIVAAGAWRILTGIE